MIGKIIYWCFSSYIKGLDMSNEKTKFLKARIKECALSRSSYVYYTELIAYDFLWISPLLTFEELDMVL